MKLTKEFWGKTPDGKEIFKWTLMNKSGAFVVLSNVGAAVVSIGVPDREGKIADVVIGYPDPMSYFSDGPCAGKIPGRVAGRIVGGKFTLDGVEYKLPVNNGPNHLHGGPEGFSNKVWEAREAGEAVEFMYFSEDGEMGYPGNLKVVAHYEWDEDNTLKLTITAETDKPTVVNLTNHTYLNLGGEGSGSIENHILKLNCSEYVDSDEYLSPTGKIIPVAGTPMDFQMGKRIGDDLHSDYPPIKFGKGFDSCWCIDGAQPGQLQTAAELYDPASGRFLEVVTDQPGAVVYTGNWLAGSPKGKCGRSYFDYDAVAIECQHFPDSPNQPEFPSVVLRPGEVYESAIIWAFSVK